MVRKSDTKRTKIVCTIGPSSSDEGVLRAMIHAGMDVARINFSHGSHETHRANVERIRRIALEEGAVVAILGDLQGPKIRLGLLATDLVIKKGDRLTLTDNPGADGSNMILPLPHPEFLRDVKPGHLLLLDDGNYQFKVLARNGGDLLCEVLVGGVLKSRKGVSAPESKLTLSALPDKDREDVKFALEMNLDYIAMSFVRKGADLRELRWLCQHLGHSEVALIAKIEKREAVDAFDDILEEADGIMVARGDLGVETPAENVPIYQKSIIKRCNEVGKPVITATQMLQSMVDNPRPTRAEASDVANAIFDGTDAIMLSNETASGSYPVLAVETMTNIAIKAEKHFDENALNDREARARYSYVTHLATAEGGSENFSVPVTRVAGAIADAVGAKLVVTTTFTGSTARLIARSRPRTSILCVTPREVTMRRMALVWGVYPMLVPEFYSIDEMIRIIVTSAANEGLVTFGDVMVLIAGVPFGVGGHANFLKVHRVGESAEVPSPYTEIVTHATSATPPAPSA
jgi:pyruvate kinase